MFSLTLPKKCAVKTRSHTVFIAWRKVKIFFKIIDYGLSYTFLQEKFGMNILSDEWL